MYTFAALKKKYNKVRPNDFEYFEALGQGGFGVVFKVRKVSTGMMYALKIVPKGHLLRSADTIVDLEVKILAAVRHPFIISMDYSFQSPQFAFIAMELAEGGTLWSVLKMLQANALSESQVRFYVAEIVEALHYLHGIGLIYRDLKPDNVLISSSGHVKLADLGGVSDTSGTVIHSSEKMDDQDKNKMLNAYSCGAAEPVYKAEHFTVPQRRRSFMGTRV
jgi:serine/threonine protein kinase